MTSSVEILIESALKKTRATGKTRLVGIFGKPVGHTLSPSMQNAAFEAAGLDWHYTAFEVEPSELGRAATAIKKYGLAGVNVTVPHKEKIIEFLDGSDDFAGEIGAVNTIANAGGRLIGHNTDACGFLSSLDDEGFAPEGKIALIIGAGGASHAVAAALKSRGAGDIFVFDIVAEKARRLAEKLGVKAVGSTAEAVGTDLIVNASPVGMKEGDPSPLSKLDSFFRIAGKDGSGVKKNIFVYDLVYNRKTKLLMEAEALGLKSAGGLGMLLHQGARAFEIWTGQAAPLEAMRKNLKSAVGGR
ncbi:MAG: shikimate dehydrogenase [Endomicrobiia bacterium]|nr:shikimate dehydrogenase [Endomicrobiia bacterium]